MVMAPVSLDGHLLVDGGIMDNVPVDPLPEVSNVGTLIVADVADCFYTADEACRLRRQHPSGGTSGEVRVADHSVRGRFSVTMTSASTPVTPGRPAAYTTTATTNDNDTQNNNACSGNNTDDTAVTTTPGPYGCFVN